MNNKIKTLWMKLSSMGLEHESLMAKRLYINLIKSSSLPPGNIEETPELAAYEQAEGAMEYDEPMQDLPSDLGGYEDWAAGLEPPAPPELGADLQQEQLQEQTQDRQELPALLAEIKQGLDYTEALKSMFALLRSNNDPMGMIRELHNYSLKSDRSAIIDLFGSDKPSAAEDFIAFNGLGNDDYIPEDDFIEALVQAGYSEAEAKERLNKYEMSSESYADYVRGLLNMGFDKGLFRTSSGKRRRDKNRVLEQFGFLVY